MTNMERLSDISDFSGLVLLGFRICGRKLLNGTLVKHFQVVPSIAIAFVTYEAVKDVLGVEIRISE